MEYIPLDVVEGRGGMGVWEEKEKRVGVLNSRRIRSGRKDEGVGKGEGAVTCGRRRVLLIVKQVICFPMGK